MAELPSAEQIEAALGVLGSRAYLVPDDLGVEQGYEAWLEVTHAARAYASILRGEGPTIRLLGSGYGRAVHGISHLETLPDGIYALVRIPQAEDTE